MRNLLLAVVVTMLGACDPDVVTAQEECGAFLGTYCDQVAACNPEPWGADCRVRADEHCATFEGPLPGDTGRCLELVSDAACDSWTPELAGCFATYTE